ncbi:MAG: class I SAM-dependent methyltransferase [Flavobacteriaceae bacterium]|nr:class I SAM-dependent methyltransferase [Flavobacteriaceae bacterium]
MSAENYLALNKESWNKRTAHHVTSDFYAMDAFKAGKSSLMNIELGLLGDVKGKRILHLQCHFGQDSLSLTRMGAKVTGIDLSDKSIETAKELNTELNLDAAFIVSDVYDLPNNLQGEFDIVYTSYGTIGWLPDMNKWASVINHFLKPDGKFVFVEFHPNVWMYDDDFTHVKYNYFKGDAIVEEEEGTYADKEADVKFKDVSWNHGLSEVISGLLNNGLTISDFKEYNYSPYDCFAHTEKIADRKYQIKAFGNKMPLCYSIVASK